MSLQRTIDYSDFDGLLIERAMADQGFDSRHVRVTENLLRQGATVEGIVDHLLEKFPSWTKRANATRQIVLYISEGRRAEE